MNRLHIAPNKPVTVALVDPEGEYDAVIQKGTYQTTAGEILMLPREAVEALNDLGVLPGEPITFEKRWTGKAGDRAEWHISRPPKKLPEPPKIDWTKYSKVPLVIHEQPEDPRQPRLPLDLRPTGTGGPTISPALRPRLVPRPPKTELIPADVAVKEILEFLNEDPKASQMDPEAKAGLAVTVFNGAVKSGQIGLWRRKEK